MRIRRTVAVAAAAAGFMTVTAGCGLTGDDDAAAPASASPEPTPPFTTQVVAAEIAGLARAGGLPAGDTSAAGLPDGSWRTCVAPWKSDAPDSAGAFDATVMRLRQHDWEIISSHAEQDTTYRTLAKRGWKLYARYEAVEDSGAGRPVSLTAVEDGCHLPEKAKDAYEDPA
ncbi:hypothetical protein [Streptomyces sp. NBC_01012]|uniref:hypothetical protein n=1 Tax=Streptomyces sp. NBC_01012 TaxID=2903717 RepID=UPI00386B5A79|nr:hypothetical protein OG623_25265 [Streptomyces sp. NBC_01012]